MMLVMRELLGLAEWYWPAKVMAICFPALRGGVSPSKISVSDGDGDCDGDVGSAIVAY